MKQTFLALPEHRQGILAVCIGAILWSTAGVFIKLLPQDAYTILFWRSSLAAALFGVLYGKKVLKVNRQSLFNSLFYWGLLTTFVVSTKLTTAANSILLQYTAPIYVLLAEPLLFKIKLQKINVVTIVVCLLGMGILLSGDLSVGDWSGNLIALLSGFCLAALLLGQRLNPPEYHVSAIFWGNIIVALVGLPFFLQSPVPTVEQAGMLGFLGIFQIGLGYVFFTYGLKRVLAIESALLAMLEPILNPVWVFIGYGEKPGNCALIGGVLILVTLACRTIWIEREKRKSRKNTPA
jgi:drug/metabolite transporter (DMT)-like permease